MAFKADRIHNPTREAFEVELAGNPPADAERTPMESLLREARQSRARLDGSGSFVLHPEIAPDVAAVEAIFLLPSPETGPDQTGQSA